MSIPGGSAKRPQYLFFGAYCIVLAKVNGFILVWKFLTGIIPVRLLRSPPQIPHLRPLVVHLETRGLVYIIIISYAGSRQLLHLQLTADA